MDVPPRRAATVVTQKGLRECEAPFHETSERANARLSLYLSYTFAIGKQTVIRSRLSAGAATYSRERTAENGQLALRTRRRLLALSRRDELPRRVELIDETQDLASSAER